jgi:RNA polymerase sigma-70 factor (ECF subfamily)
VHEEQSLVERAQNNDQEAFAELYERYFDRIYRYITLKIGDRHEAEDMTQQVFLKALKSISSFKWRDVPFSAWLYRIAHNQIVDYLRQHSRRPTTQLDETTMHCEDCGDNPQKTAELRLDIEELIKAVKHLTAAQREVIALRFSSELPIADVARIMGKSEGAVKALQHSAVVSLRKIMVRTESYG